MTNHWNPSYCRQKSRFRHFQLESPLELDWGPFWAPFGSFSVLLGAQVAPRSVQDGYKRVLKSNFFGLENRLKLWRVLDAILCRFWLQNGCPKNQMVWCKIVSKSFFFWTKPFNSKFTFVDKIYLGITKNKIINIDIPADIKIGINDAAFSGVKNFFRVFIELIIL